jgi:manganese/zinc/iron transport system permease protein
VLDQLLRLITFQDSNTRVVLLGATLLGIAAAVIGCFAVLRRRSLMGDAVAHAALPGIGVAFFVIGDRNFAAFMLGALVFGILAAIFVSLVKSLTRTKEDAAIAMAIGGFFGLGIVLSRIIQNRPDGNRAGLDGFIFGKAASMVGQDAVLIAGVAVAVLVAASLLFKEFKLLCFDREFAAGQGWPTFVLDLALMALVCVCTVVGLPAVGVVLMVALLVIPPVAARFWTNKLGGMLMLAASFGGASGLLGTALSATVPAPEGAMSRGWPTGPLIVLVAAAIFVVSLLAAPKRGLIADVLRRASLRRRIASQNLLRDVYEALEPGGDWSATWRPGSAARAGAFPPGAIRRALRAGEIMPRADGFVLTPQGQIAAAKVVRAHRLWELYLIEQADIAADHVDRDADQIEHILPAGVIAALEDRLIDEGRLPARPSAVPTVPASPHPITHGTMRGKGSSIIALALIAGLLALSASRANAAMPYPAPASPAVAFITGLAEQTAAADRPQTRPDTKSHPGHGHAHAASPPPVSATPSSKAAWFKIGSYEVRSDDLWTVATAVACSVACGLVGCFLVLRRMALLGDAISHAILPGLALAFIFTQSREPLPMLAGAMVVGVLTALISAGLSRWGRVPEDASMGVVFTTLFAVGVILITLVARDVDLDPGCVLYGLIEFVPYDTVSLLGTTVPRALVWLAIVLAINVGLIVLFYKELKIVCFDPYLATTMGISAALVHYGLMTAVAATSVASFEAVGSILVIAMLVAPGATAHLLTDKLSRMLWWAAGIATLDAVLGYALAVWLNTSVAGMIATVSLATFILTALVAPRYGVLVRVIRRSQAIVTDPNAPGLAATRSKPTPR